MAATLAIEALGTYRYEFVCQCLWQGADAQVQWAYIKHREHAQRLTLGAPRATRKPRPAFCLRYDKH